MVVMTEKELVEQLAKADKELHLARLIMAEAKKRWVDAETNVIGAKIHRNNLVEDLRMFRKTTPKYDPSGRELEIIKFQEAYPELVEWAKQRDHNK